MAEERKEKGREENGAIERGLAHFGIRLTEEREDFVVGIAVEIIGYSRKKGAEKAVFVEQVEKGFGGARFEHAKEFFEDPRRGTFQDFFFTAEERLESGAIDIEIESSAKLDQSNHSDRVLNEADVGLANGAEDPFFQVGIAADIIDDGLLFDIVEEAVDREITAKNVLLFGSPDIVSDDQIG